MAATAVLIGAGDRGMIYAGFALAHPERLKVVAVAEPDPARRERAARLHGIPPERRYRDWAELLAEPRLADGCIVATQDRLHVEPCLAAFEAGYHVLLEKPMALSEPDCARVAEAARGSGRALSVCHVLRHTAFWKAAKAVVDRGDIGEPYSIFHAENVSYHHMAHSYVRGNWRDSASASPMILAKCCHDLDLIAWLAGRRPLRVASFGALSHFRPENAPPGATPRCTDGCRAECQYDAVDTYLRGRHMKLALRKAGSAPVRAAMGLLLRAPGLCRLVPGLGRYVDWPEWPTSTITTDLSEAGVMRALREGPYGRCVYACDNDQVDHQETIFDFEGGLTATLRMQGHSHLEGRTLRIDGSRGTLLGTFGGGGGLEVHRHRDGRRARYPVRSDAYGHAEGDRGMIERFTEILEGRTEASPADEALMSHRMAFAAHESRAGGRVVSL
ncbi:MAG: Gfo/Idh/MocA family oxidoreductase [Spirochaetes bacterium]|nr:Gfo/Idh/MocA family oxidoreductase [Spirochaetota bacterium]MBU1082270.1 Gfo/Idh/MocA family oxidoreductase [Spirochaetota bacterium]